MRPFSKTLKPISLIESLQTHEEGLKGHSPSIGWATMSFMDSTRHHISILFYLYLKSYVIIYFYITCPEKVKYYNVNVRD